LARAQQVRQPVRLRDLVTALTRESGHPRDACLRFARQLGVSQKREYRLWTEKEQQQLLFMLESQPVRLVALKLKRSQFALYGMLHRMGVSAMIGKDNFSKYLLATLLHCRPETVARWVSRGLLPAQTETTARFPRTVIAAADFEEFCKNHPEELLRQRIRSDRLEFVFRFVFPRKHGDLLSPRSAKIDRNDYDERILVERKSVQPEPASPPHFEDSLKAEETGTAA
jgi:hypothetical protein